MWADRPDATGGGQLELLRRLCEQAARAGGEVARQLFATDLKVRFKADRSEVCDADEAAQAAILAALRAQRPSDAFLAEETLPVSDRQGVLPQPAPDRVCWIIDPVDGTRNFVRGIPLWACSVAAMLAGMPVAGAIYDPHRDRLYSADRDSGLLVNGRAWTRAPHGRSAPGGGSRRPIVGLPSTPRGPVAAIAHRWLDRCICRCLGSTALHLAMVATGELNGALTDNSHLWDLAAGWVLIRAAGGEMTSPAGDPLFPVDLAVYRGEELPALAIGVRGDPDLSRPGSGWGK